MTTHQVLQKGWALKVPKRAIRFWTRLAITSKRNWDTGHEADPVKGFIDIGYARDELGRRLLAASECPQTHQIRSFLSRLVAAQ